MTTKLALDVDIISPELSVPTPRQWKKRMPQDAGQRYNGFRFAIPDYKDVPQVDNIFEINREEEQKRKNSIEYRLESYLELWDVVVCIEHCHNCDNHGASLRHNAAKYVDSAVFFHKYICRVLFNAGYSVRVGLVRLHLTNESRIGAFEIDIFCRSRLNYVHTLLHSKLLSLQWPTKRSIENELMGFLNRVSLPRWKDGAGAPFPVPTANQMFGDDVVTPAEYGSWEDLAPSSASWACPVQDVIGEFSRGPDSPIDVEWVFDNRQSQPFHPVVGGYCRVAGLPSAIGGTERLSLLAFVTETTAFSAEFPHEDCVKVKLKYSNQEYIVPISACCELSEYTPLRTDYSADEFPEELALVLLFLMASRKKPLRLQNAFVEDKVPVTQRKTSNAGFFAEPAMDQISTEMRRSGGSSELTNKAQQRSPRSSPRSTPTGKPRSGSNSFFPEGDSPKSTIQPLFSVNSPGSSPTALGNRYGISTAKRLTVDSNVLEPSPVDTTQYFDEWTPLSENDKVVFEKVFLCRASLFVQLREKVAQLEQIVLTDSNISGTVYHPISGNFVDLQQSYSEEVLNWLFARYSIADMYQLEDIVERLYLMAVDEFVNCVMDQVAPKYAYKLQCFLLRHCIRDRWWIIANTNYFYRQLVDNISSITTEDCLLLTTKFIRSTMKELCEFMAGLRQKPDEWLSRVPYIIGALDARAAGSISKADLRQALQFLSVPERITQNDEYMSAMFLSLGEYYALEFVPFIMEYCSLQMYQEWVMFP
jgi:hypothetical protein